MPLAPATLEHELGVGGMQGHVHAAVDGVGVADLAAAGAVELCFGEEAEAVRLKAGDADAESRGVPVGHGRDLLGQFGEGLLGAFLARLAVRGDAGDLRTCACACGHPTKVAEVRSEIGGHWYRGVWVFEGEEAEETDAYVAGDGRWCASWSEIEEGGVVSIDETACWQEEEEER